MRTPIISIIVPVYNVESYLSCCIDSILNQTFSDWELLLINDGSKDGSGTICDLYASRNNRIRVFHQVNQGVSSARNQGIELAKGKYLMFIDADDYVAENILEKMLYPAEIYNIDVVLCGVTTSSDIKLNIPTYRVLQHDFIMNGLYPLWFNGGCNLNSVCAKLYRRKVFLNNDIRFENRRRGEDWLLNIKLFQRIRNIYYLPLPLYIYVRHADSAMTAYLPEQFELWIENRNIWHHIIEKYRLRIDDKSFNTQWITKVFYYLLFVVYSDNQYRKKLANILHSKELYSACLNSYLVRPYSFQLLKILLKWHRHIEIIFLLKIMSWWIYKHSKK
ncbi:glycosyltransferase [uncultured Parabacteroides sp.]|uniref:glycosyltransferase family 2 protein n=1 Tax=uncultured Parabacteroides sp. TaxID=512312 RepID=UPI002631A3CF|nr:glycosyltransferase [uncultured Parabacteroides sp.]